MPEIKYMSPSTLGVPLGQYSQLTRVKAPELVFVAGQVGADRGGAIAQGFEAQCAQAFANILLALESVGAGWRNVVQFTTYLVSERDIQRFMAFRLKHFPGFYPGGAYPPNTLLIIDRLVKEELEIEIHTVAAL